MRKPIFPLAAVFFILSSFIHPVLKAQIPQHTWGIQDGSIRFCSPSGGRRRQSLYYASDFTGYSPGNITTIYFKRSSTSAVTINSFSVRLGTTNATNLTAASFLPTTTVYSASSFIIPAGTAGDWVAVTLQTPF